MAPTALGGLRVLDLSRILAAPLCTQWLADLGAEVIKVERPGVGDESRTYGPPFMHERNGNKTETAAFYLACNRNKRSITIDHSKPEGQRLICELAAKSDVLVENFRTGVLKKYGLDYPHLKTINPRLVYLSVTGFGQDGPYAQWPGYDGIFQAMCGMISASGHPDAPMKVGVSMVDILTSLFGAIAILSALRARDQTGEGQHIDLSLLDCGLASLSHFVQNYLISGEIPQRRGNGGFGGVPSQMFQCKDRPIFIVAGNDKQFFSLCEVIERMDLLADPRFNTTSGRIIHRGELLPILDSILVTRTRDDWCALLEAAGVPVSPVNEMPEVFANPQILHRGMLAEVEDPVLGVLKLLANPMRFSLTPINSYTPPPRLGEHTAQVLRELVGIDTLKLQSLRETGVV